MQVKHGTTDFACAYCAANVRVEEEGGTVSLRAIHTSTNRLAAELAITRLRGDVAREQAELARLDQVIDYHARELANPPPSPQEADDRRASEAMRGLVPFAIVCVIGYGVGHWTSMWWGWASFFILAAVLPTLFGVEVKSESRSELKFLREMERMRYENFQRSRPYHETELEDFRRLREECQSKLDALGEQLAAVEVEVGARPASALSTPQVRPRP